MNNLAIVIPYYKIDFFEETLQSVAAQTDSRFTLYIGNDASPHDPLPLIQKYFPEGNYQYFNYEENLGGQNLAMQWERILENVDEEWFQILGDDDMVSENFVAEFYKSLPSAANVMKVSQCFVDEHSVPYTELTTYPVEFALNLFVEKKFIRFERSSLSEHIFRRVIFIKTSFRKYPLAWYSDDMAVIEVSQDKSIRFIDSAKVYVRVSDKSISGSHHNEDSNRQKDEAAYLFYGDLLKDFMLTIPKRYRENIIRRYMDYAYQLKRKSAINLFKAYLATNSPYKALGIPRKIFILNNNARKDA